MFEYFYHEIFRKTIIGFGTLFNDISIKHTDSDGNAQVQKVPLAYGPIQKFLARLEQSPDLNKRTQITLPRMSFEFVGLTYDPTRKVTTTQQFTVKDNTTGKNTNKAYMPVPYSMQFELGIMCKLNDDALQIVEQILPYFQPSYNLTIKLVESMKEKRDIPIVLENVTFQDDYEGDFNTRRVLYYTLRFTAKTYLFGPVSSATDDIVKSVSVRYLAGGSKSTERDVTYSVTPRAIKDYDGSVTTNLAQDITISDLTFDVDSGSSLTESTYVDVDGEEMYIDSISGNKISVKRGQDGTTVEDHVRGAPIKAITDADDALIEMGDDFGFSGEYT
tara:strand:+ start:20 stop:1015 length:996 start_codon:yes stop_codon:yes gene_type:complete